MANVLRCDSTIAAGFLVCGNSGVGVLAEDIPATGADGASPLYNDLSFPADNGKIIRMEFTTLPPGTLTCDEYGRLAYDYADGSYQALYQLYVDGLAVGSPATISFQIGPPSGELVDLSPMAFTFEQAAAATVSNTQALAPMVFVYDQSAALIYGNTLTLDPMEYGYEQIAGIGRGGLIGLSPMVFDYTQSAGVSISATVALAPMVFEYQQSAIVGAPISIALAPMAFRYWNNVGFLGGVPGSFKASINFVSARTYGRMI